MMPSDSPESTIAELFSRDPFSYTTQDLDRIIAYYRERRLDFAKTGKGQPRVEKATPSLGELGL